jgi:hypothetical protein
MPSISGYDMIFIEGILIEAPGDYRTFTRAGIVGTGIQLSVRHDPVQRILSNQLFDTLSNAETALANYRLLESTNVTVVDQFGNTWSNATVCRVVPKILGVVEPSTPWLVVAEWEIILETT